MTPRHFKSTIYGHLSRVGKAFSSPRRLEMLDLLAQAPRSVEDLARLSGQSIANCSAHLKVLRAARLVLSEKRGQHVLCRLADDDVAGAVVTLHRLGRHHVADIERDAAAHARFHHLAPAADAFALAARLKSGTITLLDVRPMEEFAAGHVAGAISIPLVELGRRAGELPRRRPVLVYCRGPLCGMAADAARRLRRRGWDAQRLEIGVAEWRADGGRVVAA